MDGEKFADVAAEVLTEITTKSSYNLCPVFLQKLISGGARLQSNG